jgi:hypothetical protein
VPGREAGQAQGRPRHEDEQGDGEQPCRDHGADRADPADRVPENAHGVTEQAPVEHQVERPVESRREAHVDDLHNGEQSEDYPDQHRRHPPRPRRQQEQERDGDENLYRDAHERGRREVTVVVRREEGEEHEQAGQRGPRPRQDAAPSAACARPILVRRPTEASDDGRQELSH